MEKSLYMLDFDSNGFLDLTSKNAELIQAILRIDSSYRKTFDVYDSDSAWSYIRKNENKIEKNKNILEEICRRIDRENSTHLAVSGLKKGDNKGITLTAEKIAKEENLIERLKTGDPELVKTISGFVQGRNNFSFASKFCAYMCRFLFSGKPEADNYAIYDGVLADVLPYYAFMYGNKDKGLLLTKNNKSTIEKKFKQEKDYEGYRTLIDEIRDGVKNEKGCEISREELDSMLWYYYKRVSGKVLSQMAIIIKELHQKNEA